MLKETGRVFRDASYREAQRIAAEVLHPLERSPIKDGGAGEVGRRDSYRDIADLAARAGGMVHRNFYYLMPLPEAARQQGRTAVPDDLPCLINAGRPARPQQERESAEFVAWKRRKRRGR
jgi:hypothetical protein